MKSMNDLFEYLFNEYQLDPKLDELAKKAKADFEAFMKGEVPPSEAKAYTEMIKKSASGCGTNPQNIKK